jgi:hypothetical protein
MLAYFIDSSNRNKNVKSWKTTNYGTHQYWKW